MEGLDLLVGFTKAPDAQGVRVQGILQGHGIKIRPQQFREIQLRVGGLPNQEVTEP